MRVIVLGASGQIGSAIFKGLIDHFQVIGTSRRKTTGLLQFDPFRDDWSRLGMADVLVNCVGQIQPTQSMSFGRIHIELTERIIRNRIHMGSPRIIQISALGASADHKIEFLRTKGIADNLLLEHPDTFILRPSIVCTPNTMIVGKMRMLLQISQYTKGLVFIPRRFPQTRIQPVMATDLIDVVRTLCMKPGVSRLINVVGPEVLSFRELITMVFKSSNAPFRIIEVPRTLTDLVVHLSISRMFPGIITAQQYQLLFADNVADEHSLHTLIGRPPLPTTPFFITEFSHAPH